MLVRRLARPMLASIFIQIGVNTLRNPEPVVAVAGPWIDKVTSRAGDQLPDQAPTDAGQIVRIDAGVKVGAGLLLALGKLPRTSSVLLAGSLAMTTAAGHAFWEQTDPAARKREQIEFTKNVSLLGGLILAAVDTEGKPSLGWRGRRAARKLAERTSELTGSSSGSGAEALDNARGAAVKAGETVRDGVDIAIGRFVA